MIPQTPNGLLYVNSSLSGSSELTVCPYNLLPSDWKNRQVSIASWISPPHSFIVFPISRACKRTRSSFLSINNLPMFPITWPLVGAGVEDQDGNAFRAARRASCTSSLVERGNSPKVSSNQAGFLLVNVLPSPELQSLPAIILYPLIAGLPFGFSIFIISKPVSST